MFYALAVVLIFAIATEGILWKINKHSGLETAWATAIWGAVFAGGVFGFSFVWTNSLANLTWNVVGWTVVVNVFTVFRIWAWVKALKYIYLSLADPLSLLQTVLLVITSWLIFGGTLGGIEIGMIALIFVSGVGLGLSQRRDEKRCKTQVNYKLGLAFLMVWVAAAVANELPVQEISRLGVEPVTFTFLRFILMIPMMVVIILVIRKNPIKVAINVCRDKIIIAMSLLWVATSTLVVVLLDGMNIGVLYAILTASTPLVVIASYFLFRERLRWYNYLFMVGMIAGVIVLAVATQAGH